LKYSSLTEQLTANFYRWEQRGRGWLLWDRPVEIEPPFEPFSYKLEGYYQNVIDDGRKPTFLSTIADSVSNLFRKQSSELIATDSVENIFPEAFTDQSQIHEIRISITKDTKVTVEEWSQVLVFLSSTKHPLSFEILGTHSEILIQIVCREYDFSYVWQILKAHLPNILFEEKVNSLEKSISVNDKNTLAVDFGLSEEFMRPLKVSNKFEPDPLTGIIGILDNLQKGEVGLLQILFKGTQKPWARSIMQAVTDNNGDSFFADDPEMLQYAKEKIKSPLFSSSVRILANSYAANRAMTIIRDLASTLIILSDSPSNQLIPLTDDDYAKDEHIKDILLRRSHRSGILCNASELLTLCHLPSPTIGSNKLIRSLKKSKAVPAIGIGHAFIIGENRHNGTINKVSISNEQRLKHTHIIGATGSGKSTLLLNMILQDINFGNGIAVMDPHGDLIEDILGHIPDNRLEDVILFDPSDTEYPVGFNVLNAHSEVEKNLLESDLVATFRRFSTTWGDQMTSVLAHAIQAFLESPKGGTLADLRMFLLEASFRQEFLLSVSDKEIIYYWEKEFPLIKGNSLSSILVRLDSFLRSKIIRNIITQKEGIDIGMVMNNHKIFLVKLSQGLIGEENASLLGTLLISKFQQTAMARQALDTHERKDFFLYIDEFQQFITPSMTAILSGARKYHLGLILAHQELRQIESQNPELIHSLINNAGSRICFRLGEYDAEKLRDGFSYFTSEDFQNLSVGEAICRIEKSENDFNLRTFSISLINIEELENKKKKIKQISTHRYEVPFSSENITNTKKDSIIKESDAPDVQSISQYIETRIPGQRDSIVTGDTFVKKIKKEDSTISQHKYLQYLIKKVAEERGFKATIESPTKDKRGRIDICLERNDEKIACEIAISTTEEHEYQNIQKCLNSGYSKIFMCVPDATKLNKLKSYVYQRNKNKNILFLSPDDLISYLNSKTLRESQSELKVKGYRVRIKYKAAENMDETIKRNTVGQIIIHSLKNIK